MEPRAPGLQALRSAAEARGSLPEALRAASDAGASVLDALRAESEAGVLVFEALRAGTKTGHIWTSSRAQKLPAALRIADTAGNNARTGAGAGAALPRSGCAAVAMAICIVRDDSAGCSSSDAAHRPTSSLASASGSAGPRDPPADWPPRQGLPPSQARYALMVMPPATAPSPRFVGDAVSSMGWTLPATSMSILVLLVSLAFAMAPTREDVARRGA